MSLFVRSRSLEPNCITCVRISVNDSEKHLVIPVEPLKNRSINVNYFELYNLYTT